MNDALREKSLVGKLRWITGYSSSLSTFSATKLLHYTVNYMIEIPKEHNSITACACFTDWKNAVSSLWIHSYNLNKYFHASMHFLKFMYTLAMYIATLDDM